MKPFQRSIALFALVPLLAGCAGGWRGGAPPAQWADSGTPVAASATAPAAATAAKPASTDGTHATADGAVFVWRGEGGSVSAAGEFNSWNASADPLTKQADGTWQLEKKLPAGRYAYKLVIDGTTWKVDPTVSQGVDDGYGGKNSVIEVGSVAAAPAAARGVASGIGSIATADGAIFRFASPGGSVAVAGEFNSWNTSADPMKKQADGTWALDKKLPAGRYAYKFVVDGSTWKEDPTAKETVDDGYGGKNAVMVVGGASAAAPAAAAATPAAPAAAPVAAGTGSVATADGAIFRFASPGSSVAVAGEFNSWNTSADPMKKQADGTWALDKKLPAGRYAYKFVVDGSTWKEDPTAKETVDDGYGGKNAVMVVGGASAPAPAPAAATPSATPAAAAVKPLASGARPAAPRATADGVTFTYAGPASRSVALCGEFNSWATTSDLMTQQADGTWTLTRKLAAGTYAYKFLVDGASWKKDDGNPDGTDDGFGARNSVLVVGGKPAPAAPAAKAPKATPAPPAESSPAPVSTESSAASAGLEPVYFANGSSVLDAAARATLKANARMLRQNAGLVVRIEGHCDDRGRTRYNQALSARRARAVYEYLVRAGVHRSQLRRASLGESRPAAEGSDPAALSRNRRVEFTTP